VIQWREGRVAAVGRSWPGAVELDVDVYDPSPGDGRGGRWVSCRALAYPALTGCPTPGDLVLLNSTALERGLGTGGYALVASLPGRVPQVGPAGPGHLVKARYTPGQVMVLGADEQQSPHHDVLADADDLLGMPVVVADLHSSLPAVIAGIRASHPEAVVAYVMTDGGALPAAFSRTVAGLRSCRWLDVTVTVGQAFGGDLEAVTVHTGLLAARLVARADVTVVAQGPGNLGTGTRWGFSGVSAGEAINAVGVLRGRPIGCLRISVADPRERHRGISHHSLTAYGRVALLPADLVVPLLPGPFGERVRAEAAVLAAPVGRHRLVEVDVDGLRQALDACPVTLSTMGRGLDGDEPAFLAAAAAGRHAASLLPSP
jgi:hypothetical protein